MPSYKAPLRDMQFILFDVLKVQDSGNAMASYAEAAPDVVTAILEEAGRFCENTLQPINHSGDEEGCHFEAGSVRTPDGFKEAYAKYAEGGSRHVVPADIPQTVADQCMRAAEAAHHALGCRGVTRADFRYDPKRNRIALLEVNTQPGMTATSLVPEQAAHVGMSYDALVAWILEDASWPR